MSDDNFIRGFNAGYALKENAPDLFDKLVKGMTNESDFQRGMKAGANEFSKTARPITKFSDVNKEMDLEKIYLNFKSTDKGKSKDKGKDKS